MYKYATGLVVGKFCPLHIGHELVIRTALNHCEKVIILSYTSEEFEGCDADTRENWIKNSLWESEIKRTEVHVLDFVVKNTLKDNAPDDAHRHFCANYLLNFVQTTVQAVFTSEDYGPGFAEYLSNYFSTELSTKVSVDHVMVDQQRVRYPISGTELRKAFADREHLMNSNFLSLHVKQSFIKKILFLGGESTGKTVISEAVADIFSVPPVVEFGRYFYDKRGGKLNYEDMEHIGKTQLSTEQTQLRCLTPGEFLICDTSPLTTSFYSREWFGRISSNLKSIVAKCDTRYDKIYLCAPDFPMVQDGTRQDETFRNKGHEFYVDYLTSHCMKYTLLTGTLEEKIAKVTEDLSNE